MEPRKWCYIIYKGWSPFSNLVNVSWKSWGCIFYMGHKKNGRNWKIFEKERKRLQPTEPMGMPERGFPNNNEGGMRLPALVHIPCTQSPGRTHYFKLVSPLRRPTTAPLQPFPVTSMFPNKTLDAGNLARPSMLIFFITRKNSYWRINSSIGLSRSIRATRPNMLSIQSL